MAILGFFDKIATFLILAFFLLGVWDATNEMGITAPFQNVYDQTVAGNPGYLIDFVKMAWGWTVITPSFNVNSLPWYLGWYGWYLKIFFPSGYVPYPGWEDTVLAILILLGIVLPVKWATKSAKSPSGWGLKLIPIFFISLLLLYPVWDWINLHLLFTPGAASILNISKEEAYNIYISFSQSTEQFSWFFFIMTFLGLYKAGKWSWKFKPG